MAKRLGIGIAGLGTVGQSVVAILEEQKHLIEERTSCTLDIVAVSARNKAQERKVDCSAYRWYEDAGALAEDSDVDIVVELIGGEEGIAHSLCQKALDAGKHVVTANKALIAKHGTALATQAEATKVTLACEAAVAGGIPVLKLLREGMAANNVQQIAGILNGTCNYILTTMERDAADFEEVLQKAQEKGFAETPPDLDIDGWDAAHKLAILSQMAFGRMQSLDHIDVKGIRHIALCDVQIASQSNYAIRLLGMASIQNQEVQAHVRPFLVPKTSPLGGVDGVLNAVQLEGDALGTLFLTGAGAGGMPTASSVVADIIDIARGFHVPLFGVPATTLKEAHTQKGPKPKTPSSYYIRLPVKDVPGVLSSVTKHLGEQNVGVAQVEQHVHEGNTHIVVFTHPCTEEDVGVLCQTWENSEEVLTAPTCIPLFD